MFFKIAVLKNFAVSQENTCVGVSFKLQRSAFLLEKRLQHRCFPVNVAKFLRTVFVIQHLLFIKLLQNLCDDRILWTSLGTIFNISYIS